MRKLIEAATLDDALRRLGELAQKNEARGEDTLVFCEDRLTLLAERAVLSACGGTFRTEVTTFARFLSGPGVLSKEGSVMEISSLLSEYAGELKCFRPRAAQAVYETIAQLSASRVDADMLKSSAEETEGALRSKLLDLGLLFEKYNERLKERGMLDESGYLALLPEKLATRKNRENVVFFGFRAFTKQALEGVRAALSSFRGVTGIFLSGEAELYTGEAVRLFGSVCAEFGGAERERVEDTLTGEARRLRDGLFSPEKLNTPKLRTEKIRRFTAADEAEEFSTIAALIKKHVFEGARYRDIAVLVSSESFLAVEKAFGAYRIPFFADKKRAFSEHPFCTLVTDLLLAVSDGVLPDEADAVASSYYFGSADNYRNYLLRYGNYRGGVRRELREDAEYDKNELSACREKMLSFLKLFPRKGKGKEYTAAIRALRESAEADALTETLKASFTGAEKQFLSLDPLEKILSEIETVAGDRVFSAKEFCDGLKGALSALEISMIPQYLDAVFVGEITDSKFCRTPIVFASGLTDGVPRVSQDTAIITDGEMQSLAAIKVEIEPAIAQVNARARESFGLNVCAFTEALYLSRPLRRGKEDCEGSEVFFYAESLFDMPPMPDLFPFDCCERQPAELRYLALKGGFEERKRTDNKQFYVLHALLEDPDGLGGGKKEAVKEAGELIFRKDISPSLLERYFECPYAGFARSLRLRERQERAVLDTDTGTFVHMVLEDTARHFNEFSSEEECGKFARERGREMLSSRFSVLEDTGAGRYTGVRLLAEAENVSVAAYRQLALSKFRVLKTEEKLSLEELVLSGIADRIDESDEFIRVIDYKTGKIDESPGAYYTGRKLQLELYLRAAAKGKMAAGAFYFPAADAFTNEDEPKFRMTGFYCGEDEVVSRMDSGLTEGESTLFKGGFGDGMSRGDFEAFLDYSLLVSKKAENEMRAGNISPSPYGDSCKRCKMKSLCGFVGEPRTEETIKCGEITEIVRRERGEK